MAWWLTGHSKPHLPTIPLWWKLLLWKLWRNKISFTKRVYTTHSFPNKIVQNVSSLPRPLMLRRLFYSTLPSVFDHPPQSVRGCRPFSACLSPFIIITTLMLVFVRQLSWSGDPKLTLSMYIAHLTNMTPKFRFTLCQSAPSDANNRCKYSNTIFEPQLKAYCAQHYYTMLLECHFYWIIRNGTDGDPPINWVPRSKQENRGNHSKKPNDSYCINDIQVIITSFGSLLSLLYVASV